MIKKSFFILALLTIFVSGTELRAQESNNGKEIYANSFLNKPAPELFIQEWVSTKPSMEGKFVIVDFWATWCGPCVKSIPKMNQLAAKFSKDLIIVGISNEPIETVLKFEKAKIEYFHGVDRSRSMSSKIGNKYIPYAIVIDPKGIVRWEGIPSDEKYELNEAVIADLIKKYK